MLENPSIRRYPHMRVTMRSVRAISREVGHKGLTPQRPHAKAPATAGEEMVRSAWRRVEVGRDDRPAERNSVKAAAEESAASHRCYLSEIPCRVSSDLHEWRNDLDAVSTRGSVKLKSR